MKAWIFDKWSHLHCVGKNIFPRVGLGDLFLPILPVPFSAWWPDEDIAQNPLIPECFKHVVEGGELSETATDIVVEVLRMCATDISMYQPVIQVISLDFFVESASLGLVGRIGWHVSGQIRSRPHATDFPQKVAFWKGHPRPGGSAAVRGWWNVIIWPDVCLILIVSIGLSWTGESRIGCGFLRCNRGK